MTIVTKPAGHRTEVLTGHTYAIPIVRELRRPAGLVDDRLW
jgi:hypothetical protein